MSENNDQREREKANVRAFVDRIDQAFRRLYRMEIGFVDGRIVDGDLYNMKLVIGLKWGNEVWFEPRRIPTTAAYLRPGIVETWDLSPQVIEHHAYPGELTVNIQAFAESGVNPYDLIANGLHQRWVYEEDMRNASIAYAALTPDQQEVIGYFVDEPFKRFDFTHLADANTWYLYQQLHDQGLIRAERWGYNGFDFSPRDGRAYLVDAGMKIVNYLAAQRKRAAEKAEKENDHAD